MKKWLCVACISVLVLGCKTKSSLSSEDQEYVQTTLALLRAKAMAKTVADSTALVSRRDSIYKARHTTAAQYVAQTNAIGSDPKHAERVYNAIEDSLSKAKP